MRYSALATDYDNTIATHGRVSTEVIDGLRALNAAGFACLLVTGRELPDLLATFEHVDLFDCVVLENGALLYRPTDESVLSLAEAPPERFIAELQVRGIPVSVGRSIIATVQPHEIAVLECIRDFGLELQVIFNREAVMVLPTGVNKASGLSVALAELGLDPRHVVAIGDGENDHAFMHLCGAAVAVANAVPSLREEAHLVTRGEAGKGVLEVIAVLLQDAFSISSRHVARS